MNDWTRSGGPDALQLLSDVALESGLGSAFVHDLRKGNGGELKLEQEIESKKDVTANDVQTEDKDEEREADAASSDSDFDRSTVEADPFAYNEAETNNPDPAVPDTALKSDPVPYEANTVIPSERIMAGDVEYDVIETAGNGTVVQGSDVEITLDDNNSESSPQTALKKKKHIRSGKSKRSGPPSTMWRHLRIHKGHHELVEVLVRAGFGFVDMAALNRCIVKHRESGWTPTQSLPSMNCQYSFPLLHWAALLGRFKAVKWLLEEGFSCLDQCKETGQTALHAATLYLVDARRKVAPAKYIFERLVGLLRDSLIIQDNEMASPMHRAAEQLVQGVHPDHYEHALLVMLSESVSAFGHASQVADLQNKDGDTVLHILCKYDSVSPPTIKAFVEAGANTSIRNSEGLTPDEVAALNGADKNAKVLQSAHPVSGTPRSAAILASAVNTAQHGPSTSTNNTIAERNKTESPLSVGPKGGPGRKSKETGKGTGRRRHLTDPGPNSKKPQGANEKTEGGKKKSQRSLGSQVLKKKHLRQQTALKSTRPMRTGISTLLATDTSDCDLCLEPFAEPASTPPPPPTPPKRKPRSSARRVVISRPTRHQPPLSSEESKRKPEPLTLPLNKRPKLQPSRPKTPRVAAHRRKRSTSNKKSPTVADVTEDCVSDGKQQEEEFASYVFPSEGNEMMEVSYEPNQQEDETNNLASGTEIYCNSTPDGGQTYSLKTLPGPLNSPYFLQARHNLDAILGRLTMKSEGSESGLRTPNHVRSVTPDETLVESLMASGLMDQLSELAKKAKEDTERSLSAIEQDIKAVDVELNEACLAVEKKYSEVEELTDKAEILMRELDELRGVEDSIREKKRKVEERLRLAKVRMAHCDRIAEEAPLLNQTAAYKEESNTDEVS
jgi:ankyrin repeat protein